MEGRTIELANQMDNSHGKDREGIDTCNLSCTLRPQLSTVIVRFMPAGTENGKMQVPAGIITPPFPVRMSPAGAENPTSGMSMHVEAEIK